MYDLEQLESDRRDLEEALMRHKRSKHKTLFKFVLAIPILTLSTLIVTFMPGRGSGKSFAERIGWENSIYIIGTFNLAVFIWGANNEYNKYKNRKFDIETDIELIDSKIAKLKEKNQ